MKTKMWQRILSFGLTTCLATTSFSATTIIKSEKLLDPRSGNVLSPAATLIMASLNVSRAITTNAAESTGR